MSEIIRFPSGERENEEEIRRSVNLDIENLTEMFLHLAELGKSSPGSMHRGNIKFRRDVLLSDAPNEHILREVNASGPDDWNSKPAYYHALIAELKSRGLIPQTGPEK